MSNNVKVSIAIFAIIILAISGIFILSKNRAVEVPYNTGVSIVSASSVLPSSKVISISSLQVVSSLSQNISKVVETPNVSEIAIIPKPQIQCNLPESVNLVKTDDGCFNIAYGVDASFIFKGTGVNLMPGQQVKIDEDRLYKTPENISILKEMATDMYKKVRSNTKVIGDVTINFTDSKKTNEGFLISGGIQSSLLHNDSDNIFGFVEGVSSKYLIYNLENDNWNWKFISLKQ